MAFELYMRDDGIIFVSFGGDIDAEDAAGTMKGYQAMVQDLPETQPLLFLVDVSQVGKAKARARKAFIDGFRVPDQRVSKTALIGANRYVRLIVDFIVRTIRQRHIRVFETEVQAVSWLKGMDASSEE